MKTNKPTSIVYKCHKCGKLLPLNDNGIPTTSVWKNGNYYCWECLTGKSAPKMKGANNGND